MSATAGRFVPVEPQRLLDTRETAQRGTSELRIPLPDGVPSDRYAEYTADVERYNAEVRAYNDGLARYERLGQQYSARVDSFNQLAEEANALAVELEDIPHLLPVDLSSRIQSN